MCFCASTVLDPDDRPLSEPRYNVPIGGLIVMAAGLVGVFASGIAFDVFGRPIDFHSIGDYAFYGSIWLCIFGLCWSFVSAWAAFRITVVVAGIYLLLFLAGKLSRGEF